MERNFFSTVGADGEGRHRNFCSPHSPSPSHPGMAQFSLRNCHKYLPPTLSNYIIMIDQFVKLEEEERRREREAVV
ncbi:MAG: hypothetical protein V2G48_00435 [bacterium JZ-2024 1]